MPTLKDQLAHLTYRNACKLLGPDGEQLLRKGGRHDIDIDLMVTLRDHEFRLLLGNSLVVLNPDGPTGRRLGIHCSSCDTPCEHMGAALALILEEKLALGLSAPPPEMVPLENLTAGELIQQAIAERELRAQNEKMELTSMDERTLWTDYTVTSPGSGKTYRLALRGWERGDSYCSCPDFRKNTLGTCKHIMFALHKVKTQFGSTVQKTPYEINNIFVHLKYGRELELLLGVPKDLDEKALAILRPVMNQPVEDVQDLLKRIGNIEQMGHSVTVYPDAEEYINRLLFRAKLSRTIAEMRKDPAHHPLRKTLLNTELLPYQLDGIAFAAGAGRAVLADDMGLGKTIQGIGVAEFLAREAGITKVLVVCPASLKSQWRLEIERCTGRSSQIIMGSSTTRATQYGERSSFYTICNYEQVLRDIDAIETVAWDLIILDEGQRIKNWEAKTSRTIKGLKSPFALVLSGTPLENRLDELYSVVEFIDDRRLGPAFQFFNTFRIADERGKILGYRNLDELRTRLKPVLLRRTRKDVMNDLPPRSTDLRRIPPTDEQLALHTGQYRIITSIINKKYISEMDLLRLQKALLMCRMAANSTYLVDKTPPGYSSKLQELDILLEQLTAEEDRKIILFSEWTTMLDLIEPSLTKRKLNFVRLDGSVPQKKRQMLVHQFQHDPACKLFITTNAGSTGLNLQAANTIVNVELPWNPAILEQRIARAHRMGQKRPVQVYLLVTEDTLEENLLGTLAAKQELSLAVLDPDSEVTQVDFSSGIEELKKRLELLLGTKPAAAIDESHKAQVEQEAMALVRKEKIASAGGQLLSAAFAFLGEMFAQHEESEKTQVLTHTLKAKLSECLEKDQDGKLKMTITLPDSTVLDNLARSLAQIIGG